MERFEGAIGIPVHSGESIETLRTTLGMIADSLGPNEVQVPIIVCFNGPNARSLEFFKENSQLPKIPNLTIIHSLEGIVNALRQIANHAKKNGLPYCIFYDADISPLPGWYERLALYNPTSKLVLTHYSPYPPEILVAEGRMRFGTPDYYASRILEGDKHPLIQNAIKELSKSGKLQKPPKKPRLKGSLIRIDTDLVDFGGQKITSDSVLGFILADKIPWSITKTGFFYMPRTSFEDYLRARLRHYRALNLWGKNAVTSSESLYPKQDLLQIRDFVLSENNDSSSKEAVGFFLLREALRHITLGTLIDFLDSSALIPQQEQLTDENWVNEVVDFLNGELSVDGAFSIINRIFKFGINWLGVIGSRISRGLGITQSLDASIRAPIDLRPYLEEERTRELLFSWLNL